MIVELINTGSELLLGRVLNTHQQWLCRRLSDAGYVVSRQVAIGDTAPEIERAVREALGRADLVITTGGLGPTSDDVTRDVIAGMLGKSLIEDKSVLARIESFFIQRSRPIPARSQVEALVPEGATVLPNLHGTAPGLAIEVRPDSFRSDGQGSWLIMLPGPPRELRPMFTDFAMPLLARVMPPQIFVCRTVRTSGLGETTVQEQIEEPLRALVGRGLELGYCARPGQVDVRFAVRGSDAAKLVAEAEAILRACVGGNIFGIDDQLLEGAIVHLLTERKQTLSVAESCTGGGIADRLTNVPGASAVLLGGFVTYSDQMKQAQLGVRADTLRQHGAVSEAVAGEMAEGARRATQSHYAIAVTGIAGPGGGTPEKPVGTVFIAVASDRGTSVVKMFNPWDRLTFKEVTACQALNQLRLQLLSR
jgi:nicotinamide-nucleotide amidase